MQNHGYRGFLDKDTWDKRPQHKSYVDFPPWGRVSIPTPPPPCCPRVYCNYIRLWANILGSQTKLTLLGSFYWYLDTFTMCVNVGALAFFLCIFVCVTIIVRKLWMVLLHGKSVMRMLSLYLCFIHFFACKLNICFSLNAQCSQRRTEAYLFFFLKFVMQDFDSNGGSTMLWVMEQRWRWRRGIFLVPKY